MVHDDMKAKDKAAFNTPAFLESAGVARKVVEFRKKKTIFSPDDPVNNGPIHSKRRGRLSVVEENGKAAAVAVLEPRDFSIENAWPVSRIGSGNQNRDREVTDGTRISHENGINCRDHFDRPGHRFACILCRPYTTHASRL